MGQTGVGDLGAGEVELGEPRPGFSGALEPLSVIVRAVQYQDGETLEAGEMDQGGVGNWCVVEIESRKGLQTGQTRQARVADGRTRETQPLQLCKMRDVREIRIGFPASS